MKRLIAVAAIALGLSACAALQSVKDTVAPSPEARIINVANLGKAAAAVGTVLLKNKVTTVAQAESYSAILHTASKHLHVAEAALDACRTKTASTQRTVPDPCEPSVAQDIALAESVTRDVKKALDAKK